MAVLADNGISWTVQTVDEKGQRYGNGYIPIVLDSSNNPHIAYTVFDYPPYTYAIVSYASWNGSGWTTQIIEEYKTAYSLTLDADDNPHILYGGESLIYASWTGTNWYNQTVDENGGGYGVVVLDSSGNPNIAYTNGQVLKYANWTGDGWDIQTLDTFDGIPFFLSFALDPNNTPYILYTAESSKLAVYDVTSWNIQTVYDLSGIEGFESMALDSEGYPHFIYKELYGDPTTRHLEYVSWNGAAWTAQTVDPDVSYNRAFLALDSHDYPHISYISDYPEQLMYAYWTGTVWNIQTVGNSTADSSSYLALDTNDYPHISFRFQPRPDARLWPIMYATATINAEPTEPPSTTFSDSTLLLISAIVIAVTTVAIVYVWKRHRSSS
ncbi:MAG: hypothetical protein JSW14_01145 [Candidatus Bathyarchaeum sp.]|nr:MAG: hypothetical protein JSW14_01145 [Candidatus Bathyarchaeum sp.]